MRILCRGLAAPSLCLNSVRTFASSSRIFRRAIPIPFESPSTSPSHAHTSHTAPSPQWTPTCPSPTCDCVPMPPDLDIDRESPLANTMPHYAEQVIVCSGKEDWPSRIEDEEGGVGKFVRGMRSALGMGKGQCGALDVCLIFYFCLVETRRRENTKITDVLVNNMLIPYVNSPFIISRFLPPRSHHRKLQIPSPHSSFPHSNTSRIFQTQIPRDHASHPDSCEPRSCIPRTASSLKRKRKQ